MTDARASRGSRRSGSPPSGAAGDLPSLVVTRRPEQLLSDDRRVILRYLDFDQASRIRMIVRRIMRLPEGRVAELLGRALERFAPRHRDLRAALAEHFTRIGPHVHFPPDLSEQRKLLIGAYFTHEYTFEAAALFNPSMVPHPDQHGVPAGAVRFLMSLRATGEGHVSSIVFRRGCLSGDGEITFDPPPSCAYAGRLERSQRLGKAPYARKLQDMDVRKDVIRNLLAELPDPFTPDQLKAGLRALHRQGILSAPRKEADDRLLWPAQANYDVHFPADSHPAETTILPATVYERQGLEDLRQVIDGQCHAGYARCPQLPEEDVDDGFLAHWHHGFGQTERERPEPRA